MLPRSQNAISIKPTIFVDARTVERPVATSEHCHFSFVTFHFALILLLISFNHQSSGAGKERNAVHQGRPQFSGEALPRLSRRRRSRGWLPNRQSACGVQPAKIVQSMVETVSQNRLW
jgi:hypothetical protein